LFHSDIKSENILVRDEEGVSRTVPGATGAIDTLEKALQLGLGRQGP
jgi:hypothetical protein